MMLKAFLRITIVGLLAVMSAFGENFIDVSGQVIPNGSALPLTQITVTATDLSTGEGTVAVGCNPFGYYTFYDLVGGNNYKIEAHAQKAIVTFAPADQTIAGTQDWTGIDFSYSPASLWKTRQIPIFH